MITLDYLDALLRGAAIGVAAAKIAAILHSPVRPLIKWSGIAALVAFCAHALLAIPGIRTSSLGVVAFLSVLVASAPFSYWTFARALLIDGWRMRPFHFAVLLPLVGTGLALTLARSEHSKMLAVSLSLILRGTALVLVIDALLVALRGLHDDLVPQRRPLRIAVAIAGPVAVAMILLGPILPFADRGTVLRLSGAALLLAFSLTVGWLVLRIEAHLAPIQPKTKHAPPDIPDRRDAERIMRVMADSEPWRDSGLTLESLSDQVHLPVYRVRRIVNERLGHRNFPAFVNHARLAAAVKQLADTRARRVPILTIALDHGFGSINAFNRAFRSAFGMTPSAYRAKALGDD